MRPSAMILGKDDRKRWSKWDLLIAEAYELMQAERCGQCGLPKWICHNQDISHFTIVTDTCFAMREIESTNESKQRDKSYSPPKGTNQRPKPYRGKGQIFDVEFRDQYYRGLMPAPISG